MKWIWIRHGEKTNPLIDDPGIALSTFGRLQSQALLHKVLQQELPLPNRIITSEVDRCQATLQPLADHFEITPLSRLEFNLHSFQESEADFLRRIQRGLKFLSSLEQDSCLYLCSHQDWLQTAIHQITIENWSTQFDFWPTCRYLELEQSHPTRPWRVVNEGRITW